MRAKLEKASLSHDDVRPVSLLLDSGAFSAWRLKQPVKLEEYCAFLKANLDWLGPYVALDEIRPGDTEGAASVSMKNLEYMLNQGLDPLPVFHVGEDISYLKRIVDMGCKYICLSASSITTRGSVDSWYEYCWGHLVNRDGLPIVKAHALGEGRLHSLLRYPWYSADSTTWVYHAQIHATTNLPGGGRVALRNDMLNTKAAPDVRQLSELDEREFRALLEREGIRRDAFEEKGNVSLMLRTYLMARYFVDIERQVNEARPITFHPQGFFHSGYQSKPAAEFSRFRMYLVRSNNNTALAAFTRAKAQNMLVSYFYAVPRKATSSAQTDIPFLKNFLNDPLGTVMTHEKFRKYWDFLEQGFAK